MKNRSSSRSMALELSGLLEELSREVPDRLRGPALRLLHSVKTDQPPSREDMGILLFHLLLERKEESKEPEIRTPAEPKAKIVSRKPEIPPRHPPRPSSDVSGRRTVSPPVEPEPPIGSVFHERIQAESDEDRAVRRRFGLKRKGR